MNTRRPSTVRPPKRRLLFDRRYGWVFDEWKDPSEEALAGGRGMFCVLPLAKASIEMTVKSINFAAGSVAEALKNPDHFSPWAVKKNLNDQMQRFKSSIGDPI